MRCGGKNRKMRFLWYFNHLNGVNCKYKGLPIENTIGSYYLQLVSYKG